MTSWVVVVNHEEQYSIWPTYKSIPKGWKSVGVEGSKEQCLKHIEKVWTDMRPLSLRKKIEGRKNISLKSSSSIEKGASLLASLAEGCCEASLSNTPELDNSLEHLKKTGYAHISFSLESGKTNLFFKVDEENSELSGEKIHLEGEIILDFCPVRCIVDLDRDSLLGKGRLIKL